MEEIDIYNCIEQPLNNIGGLYIGMKESIDSESLLKKIKITHILTLTNIKTETINKINQNKIKQLKIDCKDSSKFNIYPYFNTIANFIKGGLDTGNVLVHCNKGISRSATAVIAFFLKYRNMTTEGCIHHISRYRKCIYPNYGFQNQLKDFEIQLYQEKH